MFDGIVVENIVYGELVGVSEYLIIDVVCVVNVWDFICVLFLGLYMLFGSGGV